MTLASVARCLPGPRGLLCPGQQDPPGGVETETVAMRVAGCQVWLAAGGTVIQR